RRFALSGQFIGDAIYDEPTGIAAPAKIVDPRDPHRFKAIPDEATAENVLVPVFRRGRRVYDPPSIHAAQARSLKQVQMLHPSIRRLDNPHEYPAGLEQQLHTLRTRMILESREQTMAGAI